MVLDLKAFTPTLAVCLSLLLGSLVTKHKIGGFRLGLSGVLLSAILVGAIWRGLLPLNGNESSWNEQLTLLSTLGTALFISSVGVRSGESACGFRSWQSLMALLTGGTIVAIGFASVGLIRWLDRMIPDALLLGILCGAMTSTPGLAVVTECLPDQAAYAAVGYGGAYVFGVIGILGFTQILYGRGKDRGRDIHHAGDRLDIDHDERPCQNSNLTWMVCIISAGLGSFLGAIRFWGISVGTSGGILLIGMLLGALGRRTNGQGYDSQVLQLLRKVGLSLFLTTTGLRTADTLFTVWNWRYIGYGAILTVIPILLAWLLLRFIFGFSSGRALSLICGGMTSTPAIGVLTELTGGELELSGYSFAYLGALVAMVIGIRFLI